MRLNDPLLEVLFQKCSGKISLCGHYPATWSIKAELKSCFVHKTATATPTPSITTAQLYQSPTDPKHTRFCLLSFTSLYSKILWLWLIHITHASVLRFPFFFAMVAKVLAWRPVTLEYSQQKHQMKWSILVSVVRPQEQSVSLDLDEGFTTTVLRIVVHYIVNSSESLPWAVFSTCGHLVKEWYFCWRIFKHVNFYLFIFYSDVREDIFAEWSHIWITLPFLTSWFRIMFENRRGV